MASGTDAVVELVDESDLSYPVSVRRLLADHALANVELDERGNSLTLGELVGSSEVRSFDSEADLRRKVDPLVAQHRRERRTGLVERIVNLFT